MKPPCKNVSTAQDSRLSREDREKVSVKKKDIFKQGKSTIQKTLAKGATKDCTSVQRKMNPERISYNSTIKRQPSLKMSKELK